MSATKAKAEASSVPKLRSLEQRVSQLETELSELRRVTPAKPYKTTLGKMPDNDTARDAEKLGRAYRRRQPKC